MRLLLAGWKAPSLVDVHARATFTAWFCGCSLRCPFCHNWRIAEAKHCRPVDIGELAEAVAAASRLVDMVHATGGEPMLQPRGAEALMEQARLHGLGCSVNTSCYTPTSIERLAARGLLDHVATDLKTPPAPLTGLPARKAHEYTEKLMTCLEAAAAHGLEVELRIPVPRGIPGYRAALDKALQEASKRLRGASWYIVVNPLIGPPAVQPRSTEWCSKHCNPTPAEIEEALETARRHNPRTYLDKPLARTATANRKA